MVRPRNTGLKLRQQLRAQSIEDLSPVKRVEHILNYGILAPSTHNTQPWIFNINGSNVQIQADFTKRIPEADPTGRDLYMSLGALIKNIELASHEFDAGLRIEILPDLKNGHVAALTFQNISDAKEPQKSDLLDAIIRRQNYRGFFSPDIDRTKVKLALGSVDTKEIRVRALFNEPVIKTLAKLTAQGLEMAYRQPEFRKEISSYINHNLSPKKHGLHGYSLRMNLPASLIIPKVLKRRDIGSKLAKLNYKSIVSAPAVIVLSALDDEAEWLACGQVLEEILIKLNMENMTSSIYAAAIERDELRYQVNHLVENSDHNRLPQIIFCIGTATSHMPMSVRKKLSAFIQK